MRSPKLTPNMDQLNPTAQLVSHHELNPRPNFTSRFFSLLLRLSLMFLIMIIVIATALYGEYLYLRTANYNLSVPGTLGSIYSQIDTKLGLDWEMLNDHPILDSQILINKTKKAPEIDGITEWYQRDLTTLPNYQSGVPEHTSNPIKLSDFEGNKPVILVFGRLACSYCQNIYSFLEEYKITYGDALEIIALQSPKYDEEKDWAKIVTELDERSVTFSVGLDLNKTTADKYGVEFVPTLYLIDKEGYIVYTKLGLGNMSQVETAIMQLLDID